jgi:hypothetical protein
MTISPYFLPRLLVMLLCLHALPSFSADKEMANLSATSTDGKNYAARFAAGLSIDNGQSYSNTVPTGTSVLIQGAITPDPAHVGKKADVFVVEHFGNHFMMRNSKGVFVHWNGAVPELVPALEGVVLGARQQVEVFKGTMAVAGDHKIFLGYLPANSVGLIYTPVPLSLTITQNTDALGLFEDTIFDDIVMSKCAACHVKGGMADGRAELIFNKDKNLSRQNFDIFKSFFSKTSNAYDYVLSKVSGGDRHVGGVQLAEGSNDYKVMANFLAALEGRTPENYVTPATGSFFNGVVLQSNLKTLRRAAILLAGRAPAAIEQSAVATGDDAALRKTLRSLMQGENFHEFLKDAANDRLLVRGLVATVLGECQICFPNYQMHKYELEKTAYATGKRNPVGVYNNVISYGTEEAPLELIARVVENDRPYSEILTADYTMLNPVTTQAMAGTAAFTTGKVTEFQPGKVTGYYRQDKSVVTRRETLFDFNIIVDPGQLRTNYPHVGILNDMAFLARYPSTATNRNRARARWTFFHFLGVDIEQSAQRTTDPAALADTNNPTMSNPNCTVCHASMDPVAGAFQDYGDRGFYKESWGGMDALDNLYKFPPKGAITPYRTGDTWYRDMRVPGFNQQAAGNNPDTLRWLAQQIVADNRFTVAAVRFWWPSIIGRDLLKRPEVATDMDYQARLLAYDAQEATIKTLAENFAKSGMNVKSLLVDLLMSEWFRSERIDAGIVTSLQMQAHQVAGLGNETLLTPEQLARKTWALTGYNWGGYRNMDLGTTISGLAKDYSLYYGGIDSNGVTKRSRDMTPLMSSAALVHALESSCPIVFGEFSLEDSRRKLFAGISDQITPLSEVSITQTVDSVDLNEFKKFTLVSELSTGAKKISVSFINDYCERDPVTNQCATDRNIYIDGLTLQRPNGSTLALSGSQMELSGNCGGKSGSRLTLWSVCTASYKFSSDQAGNYTLNVMLSASRSGSELAQVHISLEADSLPVDSAARGAQVIKSKLVDLHRILLGQTVAINSPEITAAYTLLAESWGEKVQANKSKSLFRDGISCDWNRDINFLSYLGYPGESLVLNTNSNGGQYYSYADWAVVGPWLGARASDPLHMKQSWQTVVAYLLSHYNYLYE